MDEDCVFNASTPVCTQAICVEAEDVVLCSLRVVAPGIESPVLSGDAASVLPSSIGAALERNCGCHYTMDANSPYFPYSGGTQIQTLQNFTGPYAGANSVYAGQLAWRAWRAAQDRVVIEGTMPPESCQTEDGTPITSADRALFEAWFEQEVPDGASFTPPG